MADEVPEIPEDPMEFPETVGVGVDVPSFEKNPRIELLLVSHILPNVVLLFIYYLLFFFIIFFLFFYYFFIINSFI